MLIKYNKSNILGFGTILIKPGINDIPSDIVAAMQDDDIIAGKFDRDELQIIDKEEIGADNVKGKNGEPPSGLALLLGAKEKSAVDMASKTVDMAILDLWAKKEKRPKVSEAINKQIAKIKKIEYREDKKKDGAKGASEEKAS